MIYGAGPCVPTWSREPYYAITYALCSLFVCVCVWRESLCMGGRRDRKPLIIHCQLTLVLYYNIHGRFFQDITKNLKLSCQKSAHISSLVLTAMLSYIWLHKKTNNIHLIQWVLQWWERLAAILLQRYHIQALKYTSWATGWHSAFVSLQLERLTLIYGV